MRMFDLLSELVTAKSMANPLPWRHVGILTSPGRLSEVGPRIPLFSITRCSNPSEAIEFTRWHKLLCRTIRSPDLAQQTAWSPYLSKGCMHIGQETSSLVTARPNRY